MKYIEIVKTLGYTWSKQNFKLLSEFYDFAFIYPEDFDKLCFSNLCILSLVKEKWCNSS